MELNVILLSIAGGIIGVLLAIIGFMMRGAVNDLKDSIDNLKNTMMTLFEKETKNTEDIKNIKEICKIKHKEAV
jgi:hypothetical protein